MASGFQVNILHWISVLGIATILHALLLLNFQQLEYYDKENNAKQEELVLNFKKLVKPVKPEVMVPKTSETSAVQAPNKQTNVKRKEPIQRKKPKPDKAKETQTKKVKTKPLHQPKIVAPKLEPLSAQKSHKNPVKEVSQKINSANATKRNLDIDRIQQDVIEKHKLRYMHQLSEWLNKYKQYPAIARRRNLQGEVVILFQIDKNGTLLNHSIVKPSKHLILNRAAVKMLNKASPMPKVPEALVGEHSNFEYKIPINFNLSRR